MALQIGTKGQHVERGFPCGQAQCNCRHTATHHLPFGPLIHLQDIFQAAERGNLAYITRLVERSLELDINQRDSLQRCGASGTRQ